MHSYSRAILKCQLGVSINVAMALLCEEDEKKVFTKKIKENKDAVGFESRTVISSSLDTRTWD